MTTGAAGSSASGPAADLRADVLVIGGGMGGLTTAARLADAGRLVIVVEASATLGGAGAISQGYLWVPEDEAAFLAQDPEGSIAHFRAMREGLDETFAELDADGIHMGPLLTGMLGYGTGRQFDVAAYIARCSARIESAGGWIIRQAHAATLLQDGDGRVSGAVLVREGEEETLHVEATDTVIATGGFQASEHWRQRLLPGSEDVLLRATPHGRGEGLRLAEAVGAAIVAGGGFYGHLVPAPLDPFLPDEFAPLALFESVDGLLLDVGGHRFCDESVADHLSNQELLGRGGRGVLVMDAVARERVSSATVLAGMAPIDTFALAARRGANIATADDPMELVAILTAWGFDGEAAHASVQAFNAALAGGVQPDPPRAGRRHPVEHFPLTLLEVQCAMTFTYPGIATDVDGHVLDPAGDPVAGLHAVGADVGGINVRGYSGGIARAIILGRRAAEAILAS